MRTLFCCIVLAGGVALAQPTDPAAEACRGRSEGDACAAQGQTGTCQSAECCTGIEPDLRCSPCLQCAAAPAPRPASDSGMDEAPLDDAGCDATGGGASFGLWLLIVLGISRRYA